MERSNLWSVLLTPILLLTAGCGEAPPSRASDIRVVQGARSQLHSPTHLSFRRPRSGVVVDGPDVEVEFASSDLGPGRDAYVRLVVDEGRFEAVHDLREPIELGGFLPGLHVLRAFPVLPSGESLKAPESFAFTYFYVDDPENPGTFDELSSRQPQFLADPVLTYNEPRGSYVGRQADSILVDFYLTRAQLGQDAYSVRLLIDGRQAYTITRWAPHYVLGLGNGKHSVALELRGPGGSRLRTQFRAANDTIIVRGSTMSASSTASDRPRTDEGATAEPVALSEDAKCGDCSIRFVVRDTLGRLDDPASPGPLAEAARLEGGQVAVSSSSMGPTVFVYGTDGQLLRRIGRAGSGPGELASAPKLRVLNQRKFAALDTRQGRINRFALDGSWLAATPVPVRAMTFVALDDRYVVSGPRTSADGAVMQTIHLIDKSGELVRSFGEEAAELPAQAGVQNLVRQLTLGDDGTLWAATMSGGRLEHWTLEGDLLESYLIADDDLRRQAPTSIDLRREIPPAQISDLAMDDDRLWVFIAVPDPNFTPGSSEARPSPEEIYDTRILVIDPEDSRVVASERFDTLVRPLGDGWAYDLVETAIGDRRVRVGTLIPVGF